MGGNETERVQILVVAHSQAMRAGLRSLLSGDARLEINAEVASLAEVGEYTWGEVDVVVQAVLEGSAAASLADLQANFPEKDPLPAWLLLGDGDSPEGVILGLPLRAWGLLPVDATAEELIAAVHALHEGLIVAAPHLIKPWLVRGAPAREALAFETGDQEALESLTTRETEVLQLLAQGLANKQIAVQLSISESTVKFHVSSIYAKLRAANRTEAVRIGARHGLILL